MRNGGAAVAKQLLGGLAAQKVNVLHHGAAGDTFNYEKNMDVKWDFETLREGKLING